VIYDANSKKHIELLHSGMGSGINDAFFVCMNPYSAKAYRRKAKLKYKIVAWGGDEPHSKEAFERVIEKCNKYKKHGFQTTVTITSLEADNILKNKVEVPMYSLSRLVSEIPNLVKENKKCNRTSLAYVQCHTQDVRRNRSVFGLYLWKSGLDGIIGYVYMDIKAGKQPIPIVFDETHAAEDHTEANLMLAYPAVNGTISTLHAAGIREGINDLRYIETLEYLIREKSEKNPDVTTEAKKFLLELKQEIPLNYTSIYNRFNEQDYEVLRDKISDWIVKLCE
jgi:hypothetical protein